MIYGINKVIAKSLPPNQLYPLVTLLGFLENFQIFL
jgi:hypothetical protein